MKMKSSLLTGVLVAMALISNVAQAHPPGHRGGWRGGVGVYFGGPFYGPPPPFAYSYGYPYAYPYVYSPPPQVIVTQPPQPQVYIEQGSGTVSPAPAPAPSAPAASADNAQNYWYYCEQSDSYYPYVKECPAGWKQVTPTPPATPAR